MIAHTPYIAYLEDGKLLLAQLSHTGVLRVLGCLSGQGILSCCGYRAGEAPFKLAIDKDISISKSAKLITPNDKHHDIRTHMGGLPSV
jgi:hypothetical protein